MSKELEMKDVLAAIEDFKTQAGDLTEVKAKLELLEELKSENEEMKKAIDKLEKMPSIKTGGDTKAVPGIRAARYMKCQMIAKIDKKSIEVVAEEMYGKRDQKFVSDVKTLSAGSDASVLIQEDYFGEIFPKLYNKTSFMQLGAKKVPMPNGNINFRKRVSGASAQWIGESDNPLGSKPGYANLKLTSKKLAAKVIVSNDLLRSTTLTADQLFLNDMVEEMSVALDKTMYYGAGTQHTPRGIKNIDGVHTTGSAIDFDPDTLYTKMVQPIKEANVPMNALGWAFPPALFTKIYNAKDNVGDYLYRDELKNGTFHGFPFVETNQIEYDPTGDIADVFFGDFSLAYVGEQLGLDVTVHPDSTYYDENGNLVSAADNDETVARGMQICDLGLIYGKAFSYEQVDLSPA